MYGGENERLTRAFEELTLVIQDIASSILNLRSVVIQTELNLYFLSSNKRKAI